MSRRYKLVLRPPSSSTSTVATNGKNTSVTASRVLTFDSQTGGVDSPGALRVEFDMPVTGVHQAVGSICTVHGISLQNISKAQHYQGGTFSLYGGMSAGLPLANPKQYGLLATAGIQQCFGNWIGTDMALTFIGLGSGQVVPSETQPVDASMHWPSGTPIGDMIKTTLGVAEPNAKVTVNLKNNFTLPHDEMGVYTTLPDFARAVRDISLQTVKTAGYNGIMIIPSGTGYVVTDQPNGDAIKLDMTDLIGQPVWLATGQIQVQTVLRADLTVNSKITLPVAAAAGFGVFSSNNVPTQNRSLAFSGTFVVSQLRHIGDSRSADGTGWITIINAYASGDQNAN